MRDTQYFLCDEKEQGGVMGLMEVGLYLYCSCWCLFVLLVPACYDIWEQYFLFWLCSVSGIIVNIFSIQSVSLRNYVLLDSVHAWILS